LRADITISDELVESLYNMNEKSGDILANMFFGFNIMQFEKSMSFWRKISPPSLVMNSQPSKKRAQADSKLS
jgi:hypothetical protein